MPVRQLFIWSAVALLSVASSCASDTPASHEIGSSGASASGAAGEGGRGAHAGSGGAGASAMPAGGVQGLGGGGAHGFGGGGAQGLGGGGEPGASGGRSFGGGATAASGGSSGMNGIAGNSAGPELPAGGSGGISGGSNEAGSAGQHPAEFRHPGILHTRTELDRMRAKVEANAQPWRAGWDRLVGNSFARADYAPNPQREVCAGGNACPNGETYMPLARDCAAAYQNALRYQVSGEVAHANAAVAILNAWSATLETITGDSNAGLRAGLYGYQLAAAAELVRDYQGWAADDLDRFRQMLLTKFYPISSDFLRRHNGTCFDHYWANWDLANMATVLAIGVFTDDRAKFAEAVDYFKHGVGTGQIDRLVNHLYPGDPVLGQGQEAGRDQGHATLVISLVGAFAKIAFDQGEDLFAYADNKILALAEYTAKYNLGEDVPWTDYTNCENFAMTAVSPNGRGTERPSWELLYNHYAKKKGLNAPYSQRFAEQVRPEGGAGHYGPNSGGFDQLGFGTLVFTEE